MTSTLGPGIPGERWGGFIFQDPAAPIPVDLTPAPSGAVPDEEAIPSAHPGTKVFRNRTDLVGLDGLRNDPIPWPTVPDQYEFVGGYYIELEDGRIVDLSFSYRLKGREYQGKADPVFAPELWVGWTKRAPQPLPASIEGEDGGRGRVGHPRVKVMVHAAEAVYSEWANPDSLPAELRIPSSLNWFDAEGRLWHVQAAEPFDLLLDVAESMGN